MPRFILYNFLHLRRSPPLHTPPSNEVTCALLRVCVLSRSVRGLDLVPGREGQERGLWPSARPQSLSKAGLGGAGRWGGAAWPAWSPFLPALPTRPRP